MVPVKATLSVILKANEVVVAEINDPLLWQRVLNAINCGNGEMTGDAGSAAPAVVLSPPRFPQIATGGSGKSAPLDLFAERIGVDRTCVEAAYSPTVVAPFMMLDPHCWESMRKELSLRTAFSVAPIAAAGTMLSLWFQVANLGIPTQRQALAVLHTINVPDKNPTRSIRNASWLQQRPGGQIVLNPAQITRAITLVKCFCTKDWAPWKEKANS